MPTLKQIKSDYDNGQMTKANARWLMDQVEKLQQENKRVKARNRKLAEKVSKLSNPKKEG